MVRNVYIYVKKNLVTNCLKYGMKLSDYSNVIIKVDNEVYKKGIHAYFTPRDCNLYYNDEYSILRISIIDNSLRIFTFNNNNINLVSDNNINNSYNLKKEIIQIDSRINNSNSNSNSNLINLHDYILGDFSYPELLISSSIMNENICIYNKILDVPLLFTTSNEFYNAKLEETFVQENLNNVKLNELL